MRALGSAIWPYCSPLRARSAANVPDPGPERRGGGGTAFVRGRRQGGAAPRRNRPSGAAKSRGPPALRVLSGRGSHPRPYLTGRRPPAGPPTARCAGRRRRPSPRRVFVAFGGCAATGARYRYQNMKFLLPYVRSRMQAARPGVVRHWRHRSHGRPSPALPLR